jgi:phage/plasmid-like protein (TIGR03299 family)
MSHEVESMFYAGEVPWHGLGPAVSEAKSRGEAIRLAGLDWDVALAPVSVFGNEVQGYRAIVRSSDASVLGIASDKYVPVQNREAFAFVDEALDGGRYETAGSLRNGKVVWLLAQLGEYSVLGDAVRKFLCFTTGHSGDGDAPVRVVPTDTRVVCANTLRMALRDVRSTWTFEHVAGVHDKLKMASETLRRSRDYSVALQRRAEELYKVKVSKPQLDQILEEVFGNEKDEELEGSPVRAKRIVMLKDRLVEVYEQKPDLQNFRGTAWGLYNAFADVAAHARPTYAKDRKKAKERLFLSFLEGNELLKAGQKAIERVSA